MSEVEVTKHGAVVGYSWLNQELKPKQPPKPREIRIPEPPELKPKRPLKPRKTRTPEPPKLEIVDGKPPMDNNEHHSAPTLGRTDSVNDHRILCQQKIDLKMSKLDDYVPVLKKHFEDRLADLSKRLEDSVSKKEFNESKKSLMEKQKCLEDRLADLSKRLEDSVSKKEFEETQRKNEKFMEEQSEALKELQKRLENEISTIEERLNDCEKEQCALKDEISKKVEELQQRTYQVNNAIANMKTEARKEREKITKRQMELEAMVEKMQLELERKDAEQEGKLNHFIELHVEHTLKSQISEQKTAINTLERKVEKLIHPCAYLCYGPMLTENDKFQLSQFDIDDQDYRRVNANFRHFHVKVFDECFRAIVLDIRKEGEEIIDIICRSFGIHNSGELSLKKQKRSGGDIDVHSAGITLVKVDPKRTLKDELNGSFAKPYLLYLCRSKEMDSSAAAIDESDIGLHQQTPPNDDIAVLHTSSTADTDELQSSDQQQTDTDLQTQLQKWNFHVMWMGIIQGAYIINRTSAIELAALLTLIYYDRDKDDLSNSLLDYNVEAFLPEMYREDHKGHISAAEIHEKCSELTGDDEQRDRKDYIADVVAMCSKLHGCYGLFYDIAVTEKTKMIGLIPKYKNKQYVFGITQYGVVKVNSRTGKVIFVRQFSEISRYGWKSNTFWLHFEGWKDEFVASSSQSREIIEALDCFMSIIKKAKESSMSSLTSPEMQMVY